jgi:hypothetical protein
MEMFKKEVCWVCWVCWVLEQMPKVPKIEKTAHGSRRTGQGKGKFVEFIGFVGLKA